MPFTKGQSGNPKGRRRGEPNKVGAEVRAFAGKYTKEAIEGLAQLARSAESETARVSAWKEILDRAVGKAPQALTDAEGGALNMIAKVIHEHRGA